MPVLKALKKSVSSPQDNLKAQPQARTVKPLTMLPQEATNRPSALRTLMPTEQGQRRATQRRSQATAAAASRPLPPAPPAQPGSRSDFAVEAGLRAKPVFQ